LTIRRRELNADYSIFLSLYLACLLVRSSYEVLKKSGRVNPENKWLFPLVFTAMCTLWFSWFAMCPVDPLPLALPDAVRWAGLGIVIIGLGLAVAALVQLRGLENIDHLITTGIFSKLRHPMYTGFLSWIVGWSMYHGALVSFLVGLLGIGNILYWRMLEERKLELQYGETYRAYRNQTLF
jgi:protein-S-isoprenylcysteine O-methyltransferase Ste14